MSLTESLFKPERKKTKEGLPLITEQTVSGFIDFVTREATIQPRPGAILSKWLEEINEENSQLANYARQIIMDYPEEIRGYILSAILSSYMLLRYQARSDMFQGYWGEGKTED